jgi:hypothetical protein
MNDKILKHYFILHENKIIYNNKSLTQALIKLNEFKQDGLKNLRLQTVFIPKSQLRFISPEEFNIIKKIKEFEK